LTTPFDRRDAVRALHGREGGLLTERSLFDLISEDVVWEVLGSPHVLPWAGVFHGPEEVRKWFETLDEHMEYDRFEPLEFFADGDTVVEVIMAAGRARATGERFESEVVRLWTFQGEHAVRVRSYYDTGAYERALSPSQPE
jgi:uncharacterized protein